MSFRYQKRINVGKGLGINLSNRGASVSKRTKFGSFGTNGFSLRTGIPGLSYRVSWGKSNIGLVILIVIVVAGGLWLIIYNLVRLIAFGVSKILAYLHWRKPTNDIQEQQLEK